MSSVYVRLIDSPSDDSFEDKEDIVRAIYSLRGATAASESVVGHVLLTLRMMINQRYKFQAPFGFSNGKEREFMRTYLEYLGSLRFDDLSHWRQEEVEYYNRKGFPIVKDSKREDIYDTVVRGFRANAVLQRKYKDLFDGGFGEFNHWYSVVQSRAHNLNKL